MCARAGILIHSQASDLLHVTPHDASHLKDWRGAQDRCVCVRHAWCEPDQPGCPVSSHHCLNGRQAQEVQAALTGWRHACQTQSRHRVQDLPGSDMVCAGWPGPHSLDCCQESCMGCCRSEGCRPHPRRRDGVRWGSITACYGEDVQKVHATVEAEQSDSQGSQMPSLYDWTDNVHGVKM